MEIGTEISHKIRSAIKSKLMELGAYVDEELPDYIMVMVANKKSQAAMTEDLNLFLGANTEKFTLWLQNLLVRLQSISVSSKKKEAVEKSAKAVKETTEKVTDKKSTKSIHRKSTEKAEKTSPPAKVKETVSKPHKPSQVMRETSREKGPAVSVSTTAHKSHKATPKTVAKSEVAEGTDSETQKSSQSSKSKPLEAQALTKVTKTSQDEAEEHVIEDHATGETHSEEEGKEETEVTTATKVSQEDEEPEFTVKAEYDEFSEEFSQEAERAAQAEEAKKQASKGRPATMSSPKSNLPSLEESAQVTRRSTTVFARITPLVPTTKPTEAVVVRSVPLSSRLGAMTDMSKAPLSSRVASSSRKVSIQDEDQVYQVPSRDPPRRAITGSSTAIKRRMPGSVLGTVKTRRMVEETEEEEEYDPLNPAVGSVASVVKVSARRSSVPRNLQANKSLLMRAVDEATKSVSRNKAVVSGSAYIPVGRMVERVTAKSRSLFTRSKHDEIMRSLKREVLQQPPAPVDPEHLSEEGSAGEEPEMDTAEQHVLVKQVSGKTPEVRVEDVMEENDYPTDYNDSRLVDVAYVYKQEAGEEVVEMVEGGDLLQVQNDQELSGHMETEGDEVEEELFLVKAEPVIVKARQKEPVVTYTPTQLVPPRAEVEPSQREQAKVSAQSVKSKTAEEIDKTRFIVTLDGVDPLKFEAKDPPTDVDDSSSVSSVSNVGSVVPIVHVLPKRQKVETVSINLTGSDAENDDEEDSSMAVTSNKKTEKCKFWPACANGNQCSYHHPCTPCRSFPNCKFGDKCLYIHPNCKYDAKCTKPDCPFTHASKRPAGIRQAVPQYISLPPQATAVLYPVAAPNPIRPAVNPTKPKCKFFPKCTNMSCPFSHPKPCRYGLSCAVKATCPFHHPALPGKDQFRWSSSGTAPKAEHISDRKFDEGSVNPVTVSRTTKA
ncbi:zinc finger CCCH domain-containing protein 14-like isoform X2 [Liolophura sinensis]|uniref:zinc finger CCCH domain-containing protein 14-like isoform X2 n=1 Tax=Liolophura sinensis TaxID=3198878 RepID=UPI003158D7FA